MGRPLSMDLRDRVVAAVAGGISRRQAAARFGVSISSAIRWTMLLNRTGDVRPRRQGGDKRSARIEAHAPLILGAVEEKSDITLAELQALLAKHGVAVAVSTLWRFFARRKITLKKVRPCGGAGPSRRPEAKAGLVRQPARSPSRAPGLHRRDRRQHEDGPALRPLTPRQAPAGRRAAWALEDNDVRRRASPHRNDRPHGA